MTEQPKKKKSKNKKIISGPNPKSNAQIWMIVSLMVMVFAIAYFSRAGAVKEVTKKEFEKAYLKHDVSKILIVNGSSVEVTLNKEAVESARYEGVSTQSGSFGEQGPHLKFEISSAQGFEEYYEKLQTANKIPEDQRVSIEVENNRSDFSNQLMSWGILILIFVGFWYFMRRMASGGAGGQIFNIGKSKAALFDADNKVKITFADVAGLDEAKEEIKEIVDFLRTPAKYTRLGGKIPK